MVLMCTCTCIILFDWNFIIPDCDTDLSEEKVAKPQSERRQLGKITMIIMCTSITAQ